MIAPRLETERLILRGFTQGDFAAYWATMRDPQTMHYLGGPIESRATAWEKFLRAPGFWALLGYGLWAVERKADGAVIGQIGYGDFKRDMSPPLPDLPEMAWLLDSKAHGQGYASEALAAVLAWGDVHLSRDVQCIISPDNDASLRLAANHGFTEIRRSPYKDATVIVLGRSYTQN